ncbi:MAG TPA: hypothetical protein VMB79_14600 [Jatrophihabitans sp.]|nr:hypothetical protein [Jatrophihabitans sp.]
MTMQSDSTLATTARVGEAVPSFAFDPGDPWTVTFQTGLARAGLTGRRVYEVGVGSGANIAFMLRFCGAAMVLGSDLDPRLPLLAQQLVAEVAPDLVNRFRPIPGSVSLIDTPVAMGEVTGVDAVVACLPQVPDPDDALYTRFHLTQLASAAALRDRVADHLAHYYPWTAFQEYPFNALGLGLNEALLRRVRACAPQAQVVLNFGCRIGKRVLFALFEANHYRPEELASCIVRQHPGTDISFFVAVEAAMRGTGYEQDVVCEFYADPAGSHRLSATEAKLLLDADPTTSVYHEISVLRGNPAA